MSGANTTPRSEDQFFLDVIAGIYARKLPEIRPLKLETLSSLLQQYRDFPGHGPNGEQLSLTSPDDVAIGGHRGNLESVPVIGFATVCVDHPAVTNLKAAIDFHRSQPQLVWHYADDISRHHPELARGLQAMAIWSIGHVALNRLLLSGDVKMWRGDIPIDPWRVIGAKISLADFRHGRATFYDLARADAALDHKTTDSREVKEQQLGHPASKSGGIQSVDLALRGLDNGEFGPPRRGRLTSISRDIAKETGIRPESVRNAIASYVREWEQEHPNK